MCLKQQLAFIMIPLKNIMKTSVKWFLSDLFVHNHVEELQKEERGKRKDY